MKKVFLIAISGLLLAGCYHAGTTAPVENIEPVVEEKTSTQMPVEENTVIYGDSGFTPKTLTVKHGITVTWKNTGSKLMWVASAAHPTHQELPGFDQLTSTGNRTSYRFTFSETGTWKYHNHVAPGDTGMVIVEE